MCVRCLRVASRHLLGLLCVLAGPLAAGGGAGGRAAGLQVALPQQPDLPLQLQQAPRGVAQGELRRLRHRLHLVVGRRHDRDRARHTEVLDSLPNRW